MGPQQWYRHEILFMALHLTNPTSQFFIQLGCDY
jgi:hypothetical protein